VIGLAGGTTPVPGIDETGDSGVYGAGPTGVIGKGNSGPGIHGFGNVDESRGGQFESTHSAQVQLVPHATEKPPPTTESVTPQAIKVDRERGEELPRDGQGGDLLALMDDQRQCTLWFCVKGPEGAPARWAQVLLGQTFPGNA